ncbi:MAG: PDZ domain-containing protein [candidate division KSB1 bacterium]|nr:PDZ domain-containing protein [candidate division KSB1 bacterium]MDZ7272871.1 PDZ domain-containing protein [candidate division KSB1 bacterium]MDZ7284106.1 PDZ domain-containing protein [candidate division KSB1 bacterium]MDZ7297496.1 PDZ domain-containing protein [candidate division KSB1 bacterium]MDZ7305632.1 PDZ domain-containing protein [candidate division KSB1 bacterium]
MIQKFYTAKVALVTAAALTLLGSLSLSEVAAGPARDESDRGWLGVNVQELTPSLREALKVGNQTGLLVTGVVKGSPADEAGIREEDVIIEFAGRKVEKVEDLTRAVRQTEPEKKVKVVVLREGNRKEYAVTVGKYRREHSSGPWRSFSWSGSHPAVPVFPGRPRLGVQVHELNNDLAPYFKVEPKAGALILAVTKNSPAAKAGLKAGDVILKVGEEVVRDPDDLIAALRDYDEGDKVRIAYVRQGQTAAVEVELEKVGAGHFRYMPNPFQHHFSAPEKVEWEELDLEVPEVLLRSDSPERKLIRKIRIHTDWNSI